ncbi:MAG: beta-glucosidase, partial [bacterium]
MPVKKRKTKIRLPRVKAGLPRVKAGQPADKSRRSRLRYYQTLKFPRGFLWGAATSAHQVEG